METSRKFNEIAFSKFLTINCYKFIKLLTPVRRKALNSNDHSLNYSFHLFFSHLHTWNILYLMKCMNFISNLAGSFYEFKLVEQSEECRDDMIHLYVICIYILNIYWSQICYSFLSYISTHFLSLLPLTFSYLLNFPLIYSIFYHQWQSRFNDSEKEA